MLPETPKQPLYQMLGAETFCHPDNQLFELTRQVHESNSTLTSSVHIEMDVLKIQKPLPQSFL